MKLTDLCNLAALPLQQAHSLPFQAYTDTEVYREETARIFHKEWIFVCMAGELRSPGDYFALQLAAEPIVLIRGDDGALRCLSNVCRHRGTQILDDGVGKVDKYLVCPYHAWAFTRAGELAAVPYNKTIEVKADEHRLPEFLVEVWNGLVFVNLDPSAASLGQRLSGIDPYLDIFAPDTFDSITTGEIEHWQTNWKLAMENAMESYHLFKVHKDTLEVYSPTRTAYYVAGSSEWSLTGGATERRKGLLEKWLSKEIYDHYVLISLPPSFVGILSYGSLGWLSAHPDGMDKTIIRSGSVGLESMQAYNDMEFTEAFFAEDKAICERVYRGMHARHGRGGKLTDMERVVVDFHQFWASRLQGSDPSEFFEDQAAARFLGRS